MPTIETEQTDTGASTPAETAKQDASASTEKSGGFSGWDLLVGIIPLVAMLPMLVFEAQSLWSREHMRFFPVALLALGATVGFRWSKSVPTVNPYRRWTAIFLFLLGAGLYAYSVWRFSPQLSHVALVPVFVAWALGRFGERHWASSIAMAALLGSTIRLPRNWDEELIGWLHGMAAWSTSAALDAFDIPCISNGSIIETRGVTVLADEVCGGWASVFAFASFAIFLLMAKHRSAVVAAFVLLLVPLWYFVGSLLRLLAITMVSEYWARDLATGWDFLLLEAGTVGLMLLLIWRSTIVFTRLLEPVPAADAEFRPVFSNLNKFFLWPQSPVIAVKKPKKEKEKKAPSQRRKKKKARTKPTWSPFDWRADSRAVWLVRGATALMLAAAALPVSWLASQGIQNMNFGVPRLARENVATYAEQDSLPAELSGGWKQIHFEKTQRSPRSGNGEFGFSWVYMLGDRQFTATIDLPFLGWHDPVAQRGMQGWTVESEQADVQAKWVWCEAELENELGGRAYSLYSLYTPDGAAFSLAPSRLELLSRQRDAEVAGDAMKRGHSETQVTYQFQVFIESGEPLARADRKRVQDCFLALREVARSLPPLRSSQ